MLKYRLKTLIRDFFLYINNPFNIFNFSPQHKKLIDLGPFDTVLHIGAEIGQELSLYKFIGVKRIIWVEPISRSMKKIKFRALFYPQIEHVFINQLISNKSGEIIEFYEFTRAGASSIFKPTPEFLETDRKRYVSKIKTYKSITVMDALTSRNVVFKSLNNLLVIDAQCSEFMILSSLPIDFINKFRILMCEISVDQYFSDHSANDLINLIYQLGYKVVLSPIRKSDDGIYARI